MNECVSCGKPADVEIESIIHPLTARGEWACEKMRDAAPAGNRVHMCVGCVMRAGTAVANGELAEEREEPS